MKKTVNQMITERIIERIESTGTLPWKKPWKTSNQIPHNLISHKAYRGINAFLLHALGYTSPCWLTMRQTNGLGGKVRRGEKATPVVFWKFIERDELDGTSKPYALLRYYNVFNTEQCDGLPEKKLPEIAEERSIERVDVAEEIIREMTHKPEILHKGSRAFYRPATDTVQVPRQEVFNGDAEYYATLFHELVHSTGHESRLARKEMLKVVARGDHDYSNEELVAEMGAAFLCGHCGILPEIEENASAYLKGWLKQMKGNPSLLIRSGAQAQKAFDYILGTQHDPLTPSSKREEVCL